MASNRDMTWERYLSLLSAYGADFDRWPAAERTAGKRLLLASAPARQEHDQAAQLDRTLDSLQPIEVSAELLARVSKIPAVQRQFKSNNTPWSSTARLRATLGLAAAAILGLALGSMIPDTLSLEDQAETDDEWGELTEIAFATHLQEDGWQ